MQSLWRHGWVCFIISAAAGLMMVTSESLWIDEGQTLRFASQPSFPDLLTTLLHSIKSEAQMPLGMLASWAGAKVLGVGEWQLRAVNLLWLGLAGMATGMSGRLLKLPALLLIFLIHPFLWFYVNEARPYAMQICAASWLVYVLARASTNATPAGVPSRSIGRRRSRPVAGCSSHCSASA